MEVWKQHIWGHHLGLLEVDIRGRVGLRFPVSVVGRPFCSSSEAPAWSLGGPGTLPCPDLSQAPSDDPKLPSDSFDGVRKLHTWGPCPELLWINTRVRWGWGSFIWGCRSPQSFLNVLPWWLAIEKYKAQIQKHREKFNDLELGKEIWKNDTKNSSKRKKNNKSNIFNVLKVKKYFSEKDMLKSKVKLKTRKNLYKSTKDLYLEDIKESQDLKFRGKPNLKNGQNIFH